MKQSYFHRSEGADHCYFSILEDPLIKRCRYTSRLPEPHSLLSFLGRVFSPIEMQIGDLGHIGKRVPWGTPRRKLGIGSRSLRRASSEYEY